jgi:hypothetical protein
MMKSKRMRWAGHVARIGKRGMYVGYWWENHKERDHLDDLDVGARIILKRISENQKGLVLTGFIWLRIGIRTRLL